MVFSPAVHPSPIDAPPVPPQQIAHHHDDDIGKLQVIVEAGHGSLWVKTSRGQRELRPVRRSLRTRIRLLRAFKDRCYRRDAP